LLEQEATGDRASAEALFEKYDIVPLALKTGVRCGPSRADRHRSDQFIDETVR
jgi:hypothetical protein